MEAKGKNNLTNYPHLTAEVVTGSQRGRAWGIHTINQNLPKGSELQQGVYASLTELQGKIYQSVTHVGPASTFNDLKVKVETHIFDFDEQVYGKIVTVYLVKHLREVKKFDSAEELMQEIYKDIFNAKAALKEL